MRSGPGLARAAAIVCDRKLDEAESAVCSLLERFPDEHDGYYRLGMVYEARGGPKTAASEYRKVIEFAWELRFRLRRRVPPTPRPDPNRLTGCRACLTIHEGPERFLSRYGFGLPCVRAGSRTGAGVRWVQRGVGWPDLGAR